MDEAAVRAAIAALTADDNSPTVADADVSDVLVVDGEWLAVVLGHERVARDILARLHQHLSQTFPGIEVEIRGGRIYRGGRGFGAKRHVIAVLGGKGEVASRR